jgi:protein gp37
MNKTKIEWCDYTWNVVRGCLHNCSYCYARRIDKRFGDGSFTPTFHPKRLQDPLRVKKPSRIFVGSMADLFGEWTWDVYGPGDEEGFASGLVNRDHIVRRILNIVSQCPQHTFIFLTKNPKGMQGFDFPDNCWCGTSVENQEKYDQRRPELLKVNCRTLFVSYEPALSPIDFGWFDGNPCSHTGCFHHITHPCEGCGRIAGWSQREIDWLIIGAQTGPGAVRPHHTFISSAINQARNASVPVFVKDNVNWFSKIQEWPGVAEC